MLFINKMIHHNFGTHEKNLLVSPARGVSCPATGTRLPYIGSGPGSVDNVDTVDMDIHMTKALINRYINIS